MADTPVPGDYVSWEDKHGGRHYGWVINHALPQGMAHCAVLIEDPAGGRGTTSGGELWRWTTTYDGLTLENEQSTKGQP